MWPVHYLLSFICFVTFLSFTNIHNITILSLNQPEERPGQHVRQFKRPQANDDLDAEAPVVRSATTAPSPAHEASQGMVARYSS